MGRHVAVLLWQLGRRRGRLSNANLWLVVACTPAATEYAPHDTSSAVEIVTPWHEAMGLAPGARETFRWLSRLPIASRRQQETRGL